MKRCATKSRRVLWHASALLAVATIVAGCGGGAATTITTANAGSNEAGIRLLADLRSGDHEIRSVRAYGTAHVVMPDNSYTGSIDLSLRAFDSLRVKVTGPFGILMGIVGASSTSYVVYNAWENTVLRGRLAPGEPLPFAGFPLRFDDAMEFLRGLPPLPGGDSSVAIGSCVEGRDAFGRFFRCELDGADGRKAIVKNPGGETAYEYFRDFRTVDGVQFPFHVAATVGEHRSVTIDFDEVVMNPSRLDFSVPYPESARTMGAK